MEPDEFLTHIYKSVGEGNLAAECALFDFIHTSLSGKPLTNVFDIGQTSIRMETHLRFIEECRNKGSSIFERDAFREILDDEAYEQSNGSVLPAEVLSVVRGGKPNPRFFSRVCISLAQAEWKIPARSSFFSMSKNTPIMKMTCASIVTRENAGGYRMSDVEQWTDNVIRGMDDDRADELVRLLDKARCARDGSFAASSIGEIPLDAYEKTRIKSFKPEDLFVFAIRGTAKDETDGLTANIDEHDEAGFSPIHYSLLAQNKWSLDVLLSMGAKATPFPDGRNCSDLLSRTPWSDLDELKARIDYNALLNSHGTKCARKNSREGL